MQRRQESGIQTLAQLRTVDMTVFCLLTVLAQAASVLFVKKTGLVMPVSLGPAVAMIAMIRWGAWGGAAFVAAGLVQWLLSGAGLWGILTDALPMAAMALPVILYGARDRDALVKSTGGLTGIVLAAYGCQALVRTAVLTLLTGDIVLAAAQAIQLIFPALLTVLCVLVLRMPSDLLCDMRAYVVRLNSGSD